MTMLLWVCSYILFDVSATVSSWPLCPGPFHTEFSSRSNQLLSGTLENMIE